MRRLWVWYYDGDEYHKVMAHLRGKCWVVLCQWVDHCTGCCEIGEGGWGSENYPTHPKHGCLIGAGCEECGYTGIRRQAYWLPLFKEEQIVLNTRMRIRKVLGTWERPRASAGQITP